MNWSRILCAFGRHSLTKWRKAVDAPMPVFRAVLQSLTDQMIERTQERHCKRVGCKFAETKPRKPRRPSNFSDTVQFVPVIPPKEEK